MKRGWISCCRWGAGKVAAKLVTLHDAGIDAFAMGFANYVDHLPYFRDEVLPRLERAGVR